MKVGYLPDTFGHNAQMPTLFKGTGIDNIIFWRGIDYDQQVERSNFNWRSAGGDEIYAYNLVHGYGAAKNMVATSEHLDKKIFPMVEKIKSLSGLYLIKIKALAGRLWLVLKLLGFKYLTCLSKRFRWYSLVSLSSGYKGNK